MNKPRIVLLQTFHPGNIGAVARAMKTMGLSDLFLVQPRCFPDEEASSRAAGALDILNSATVVESLAEAIADCSQVFATTARLERSYSRPKSDCESAIAWMLAHEQEQTAIVFGRERMGLSAEDIEQCQQLLYIEGNPDYDVLNMASAVQIVCYEYFKQHKAKHAIDSKLTLQKELAPEQHAAQQDLSHFYQHLESSLDRIGFLNKKHPGEAMQRFRQLFAKADLSAKELSMLRGVLSSIDWTLDAQKKDDSKH